MCEGSINYGKCNVCGKEGPLERKYVKFKIGCTCHSPQHAALFDCCPGCIPKLPPYMKVEFATKDLLNPIPIAIDILRRNMEEKEPGSYYHSWISNIACAIMDSFPEGTEDLYENANKAAEMFMERLLAKSSDDQLSVLTNEVVSPGGDVFVLDGEGKICARL